MKAAGILVAIIILIGLLIWLIWLLRPYVIKHDTTILFTGGLGSGKTLESVKRAIVLVRKNRFFKYTIGNTKIKIGNFFKKKRIKHLLKLAKKYQKKGKIVKSAACMRKHDAIQLKPLIKKPLIYSNIPLHFRTHLFGIKKEWSTKLDVHHICLLKEINEYSIVLIDEFPQFISQFEWDEELVQTNCNEFITFFRHYIGGHLIINAQSEDEIECHFRRKLNIGVWCFDFKIWPLPILPLFYTNRMCDFMLSDNITTMSTTYIEDNTRIHFGLFPRKAYDNRCYKPRYKKVKHKIIETKKWQKLQTVEVLRLRKYISPLDSKTTVQQTDNMEKKIDQLERNKDENK